MIQRALRFLAGLTTAAAIILALIAPIYGIPAVGSLLGFSEASTVPNVGVRDPLLRLAGGRGDEVDFFIVHQSHDCKWASPTGITLILGRDGDGRQMIEVVEAKEQDWEESVAEGLCDVEIGASFTVPDVPGPTTQTVSGSLEGQFIYPRSTVGDSFEDVTVYLDIPVTLEVVSADEGARLRSSRRRPVLILGLLAGLGLLASVSYFVARARWLDEDRTRKGRWEPLLLMVSGAAVWALLAATILTGIDTS